MTDPYDTDTQDWLEAERRMDIIGSNGNTGEHYPEQTPPVPVAVSNNGTPGEGGQHHQSRAGSSLSG